MEGSAFKENGWSNSSAHFDLTLCTCSPLGLAALPADLSLAHTCSPLGLCTDATFSFPAPLPERILLPFSSPSLCFIIYYLFCLHGSLVEIIYKMQYIIYETECTMHALLYILYIKVLIRSLWSSMEEEPPESQACPPSSMLHPRWQPWAGRG